MAYIRHNYPLGPLSWLKVGGTVKTLFIPKNLQEIQEFLPDNQGEILIVGALSNSLILDGPLNKTVIKTTGLNQITLYDDGVTLEAQCGVLDKTIANFALNHTIGGLEFLDSIPGTIGGNIFTNAGCYGSEIKDIVISIKTLDHLGNITVRDPEQFQFAYRSSVIPADVLMIYSVVIRGHPDTYDNIKNKMDSMASQRTATQPTGIATCGSTFKNALPHKSWELIKKSGAHQLEVGGAHWSSLHCNFLDNTGKSGDDIYILCKKTQQLVYETTGIHLELEIFVFGSLLKNLDEYLNR
jgi:UDP-N-acetylmuramate dehydrogenase